MTATTNPVRSGVDIERWPDIATVPAASWRTPFARALVLRAFDRLALRVETPTGPLGDGDHRAPVMRLVRPDDFVRRISRDGLIGFGESYMAGDWDADELVDVLSVFAAGLGDLVPRWAHRLRRRILPTRSGRDPATPDGSRRNIARHYDLSNAMFAAFLDETLTYSSALFEPGERRDGQSLATAQRRKIDRLLDRCGVNTGTRLLEVGTGWGELAVRAGQRGASVLTITLSEGQHEVAQRRIGAAGIAELVDVRLADYRHVDGEYDAIVSVEMIEAVGEKYWPTYFGRLDALLAPGGAVGIQAITMPHERMRATRSTYTWMHKYVFPGGQIPSVRAIDELVRSDTQLRIVDRYAFGGDYADTLAIWRQRFEGATADLDALGFDDVFARMWRFYLAYCEAGFRIGVLEVEQLVLARP